MRISKTKSRLIALSGVSLTLLFLCMLLWRNGPQKEVPVKTLEADSTPPALGKEPSVVLDRFHRIETKNGKTVWEVKAERGSYAPQSNIVIIENATLWLFRGEGKSVEITAPRAQLDLEGTSLKKAVAFDGVKVLLNGKIKTSTATAEFNQQDNTITAPGDVTIEHARSIITGSHLTVNLNTQVFELAHNVDTVLLPDRDEN